MQNDLGVKIVGIYFHIVLESFNRYNNNFLLLTKYSKNWFQNKGDCIKNIIYVYENIVFNSTYNHDGNCFGFGSNETVNII